MVLAAQAQQHQQQQQQQQTQVSTTSPEEEALKRNTDCVYFLASPLTCKKGSECEYRHSEYARVNPKDCYFWLNGNCLNSKCGFRHPPLDGLLGTQIPVSTGSSFPSLHSTGTPTIQASHNLGKQSVPCIFFQKGLCLKGDRCAFLHGPNPIANKAPLQPTLADPVTETLTLRKASGTLQKCPQEKKIPPANVSKVVPFEANKPTLKVENALPRNAVGTVRNAPPPLSTDDEFPRYKASNVSPAANGNSLSHSNRLHVTRASDEQSFHHGKDTDELFRESSPGFDVLVDNELGDSDYYHDEDQYGRTGSHEVKNLNSGNDYDMVLSVDYNSVADREREAFRDTCGYDLYDHMQGQYAWEHHRASMDRVLVGGSSHLERRSYSKAETTNQIDGSDLRYHLSKHRRVKGLRSVINLENAPDNQTEEQNHRSSSRRDSLHLSSQENSLSSRLRGRIKLPSRSPVRGSDLQLEREMGRGRNWGSVSPSGPQTSHQGRLRDRIKGPVEDDYNNNNGGKNFRALEIRRETMDDISTDFAGPKSLAELKSGKNAESKEQQQSLRKRKSLEDHQQGDLSFDGPMPLSEILKRKRGAGISASSGISSIDKEDNNQKESRGSLVGSSNNVLTLVATSNVSKELANNKEEFKSVKSEADGEAEQKTQVTRDQPSQLPNASDLEAEDGMIGDEGMEDHDLEADDQRDAEYEYEQGDEGDYTYEEGENADENAEDEYLDDEDGDDFAKKIGFMFS